MKTCYWKLKMIIYKVINILPKKLQKHISDMVVVVATIAGEFSEKFGVRMLSLADTILKKQNKLYLEKIDNNNNKVKLLQDVNQKVIKMLTNKVFDLS